MFHSDCSGIITGLKHCWAPKASEEIPSLLIYKVLSGRIRLLVFCFVLFFRDLAHVS